MAAKITIEHLKDEVCQIRKEKPSLKDDSAFVLWFLRAYIADSNEDTLHALTGAPGDKGIDALVLDQKAKQVHIVQGKFRSELNGHAESKVDVTTFAGLAHLPWASTQDVERFFKKLTPELQERVREVITAVRKHHFGLRLYYVTTGKVSPSVVGDAVQVVKGADGPADIFIIDGHQVALLYNDYLSGVAPAIQCLTLKVANHGSASGVIQRFDSARDIESWVFSMSAEDVGDMYKRAGIRLFARNVRGYLGHGTINRAMEDTIKTEPENFWYFNNGVTIVCDDAKREIQGGQDVLWVERPQVINGQQTTRTLHQTSSPKANVLVRVIRIRRNPSDDSEYESLVSQIVRATNWQNAIRPSDLCSNDQIQVYLERELRKAGYHYIRKRQTKGEARRFFFGASSYLPIKREELAQAVAACEFDPAIMRQGKEGLFDEPYYRRIFGCRALSFYLARYWLMRHVQYVAKGIPQRAYAKWVVLHFAWRQLEGKIGSGEGERRFRRACEAWGDGAIWELRKALDGIFAAVLAFYRSERGQGSKARDISTFFRLTKLHVEFEQFWTARANATKRSAVEDRIRKFTLALDDVQLS